MAQARLPTREYDDTSLRELLFLQRLSKAAASTTEPDALLRLIIEETTGAMQVEVCSIYLFEADNDEVVLTATNGLDTGNIGKARMKSGEGVTGWVAANREPLVVPDVTREPRFQFLRGVDQKRLTAMLSVPIVAGERTVGVVNVQSEQRRDFNKGDIDFLSAIAGQVAGIIERSEMHRRLEAQLEEIRGSQAIHERFTALALAGAGPGAILEAIGALRHGRVDLFDPGGFRLERPGGRAQGLGVNRIEVPASMTRGSSSDPMDVTAGKPPRLMTLTPIRAGDDLLAVLAAEGARDDHPNHRRALEHGATVLALELVKERTAAEVERRLRGDLLEELLNHGLGAEEARRLAIQAERLGYRVAGRSWVVVVEPDDGGASAALESSSTQDRLHALVSDLTVRRFPGSLVVTRPASFVLLVPVAEEGEGAPSPAELRSLESFGDMVLKTISRVVRNGSFSLGIGNATQEVHDLPRAHDEARQSLRLSRRGGAVGRVSSYRNLGAFRLLLEVQNPAAVGRFVDETLGPLLRYQQGRRTPLVETLEHLSAHHWNRRAASRALHLHVNSLSYRVQRIEQLLGVSLEDAETRVALSIALRARSLIAD
ncbi:MAG: PucR family transcriptional regulator, purine catabolism regulatory protein [Chloroflexota bacterium]|jgi:sugar diacid utilization regulator/putative methionine-R-sulfoxide reductase with GAF domain|nr:PucR family transcriptional regulator, purine catabolism regulatory protein [Chloroflexota bacterium]